MRGEVESISNVFEACLVRSKDTNTKDGDQIIDRAGSKQFLDQAVLEMLWVEKESSGQPGAEEAFYKELRRQCRAGQDGRYHDESSSRVGKSR